MMWGKEVWGVAFPFPENHLGEVKESKHFEVEGEGWSTGNQMAFLQSYETLGGDEPNAFWRKRSCFGYCWYCWHYHPKNNQKHPKKLVLVFRLAGFCEGSDTLHPESIWCFWKIVVTKAAVYEIPAGMLVDFKLRSYLGPQVFTQTHQM